MDAYDEPDQDSDLDYEESYTKRSKRRKTSTRVGFIYFFYDVLKQQMFLCVIKFFICLFRVVVVVLIHLVHLVEKRDLVEEEKRQMHIILSQPLEIRINLLLVNVSLYMFHSWKCTRN